VTLLDSEIQRCKAELGGHLLDPSSTYGDDWSGRFETAVKPYMTAGAVTSSTTSVIPESPPVPAAITLASATGFAQFARVVVDVDARQEVVTTQSLSGASLTALFTKTHSGTYPVTVEGGESIVREKLAELNAARTQRAKSKGRGAMKAIVGDIEWHDTKSSAFQLSSQEISTLRDELAAILGVENLWNRRKAAGARLSVY
jgi:hypothetical protein